MPLNIEIVTPFGKVYEGEGDMVIVPAYLGELGVLPGHTPYLANIDIGVLRIKNGDKTEYFSANGGFIEINPDKAVILCETCESGKNIDIKRAEEAKERALQRMKDKTKENNPDRAKIALSKALLRIKTANISK